MSAPLNTLTPHLIVNDAPAAIEFYKKAFGATEEMRLARPEDGKIIHASLKIGNSILMLCEEFKEMCGTSPKTLNGTPITVHIYVEKDIDAAFQKAVDAGAEIKMPLADMFWGDRYGLLSDPFGHAWSMGMPVRAVDPEQMMKNFKACSTAS